MGRLIIGGCRCCLAYLENSCAGAAMAPGLRSDGALVAFDVGGGAACGRLSLQPGRFQVFLGQRRSWPLVIKEKAGDPEASVSIHDLE